MADKGTVTCTFFDADNNRIGQVNFPRMEPGDVIVFGGKKYQNGGSGGFYERNEFFELVLEEAAK